MSAQTVLEDSARLSLSNPNMVKKIHREVRFGNYILGSTLGEGEFGKVKLGWRKDGKVPNQVAIKLIKRDTIIKDSESETKVHREINSLKLLNHPNIVSLVEVMKSGKYIGIVLEYASGGELFDYILSHKFLKENIAKKIFGQLVSGVDYMHSKGLIHRDLKLENLLLDKHKNVIISDFGFVNSYNKDKNDFMKTSCGSPCYAAPELVLTQSPYEAKKVDIWSLGIILYAMLAGYLPFDDDPENEDGSDIVKLYHYICKTPLTFPEYISPLARDLLRKIIVPDPKKRMNIDDIRNHPWLSPYANLLSIRQPEWDRIHKDNITKRNIINNNNNPSKRYSMINEKTNSNQLMSNLFPMKKQQGRSFSATGQIINESDVLTSNVPDLKKNSNPPRHGKSASISNSYPSPAINDESSLTVNNGEVPNDKNEYSQNNELNDSKNLPVPISLPRSTTYTGLPISTIVESPSKPNEHGKEKDKLSHDDSVVEKLGSQIPNVSKDNTQKLPHNNKKPRPTSYHPTNPINSSANSLFDYKVPSPINMPMNQFLSSSPPKTLGSTHSTDSSNSIGGKSHSNERLSNYNTMVKSSNSGNSRRNSQVTPVHVNGVLTRESTNSNTNENKRNSVLLYLEDRMSNLELNNNDESSKDQLNKSQTNDGVIDGEIKQGEETNTKTKPNETSKVTIDNTHESKHSKKNKETMDEIEKVKSKKKEKRQSKRESIYRENKENKEVKENKKRNRFSILSFYSTYNSSSNNITVSANNSSNNSSKAPSPKPSTKKVLEPSEVNVPKTYQKRIGSDSSSKSSSSRSSNNKEASAAKKVMDFFKRKSIKVN